MWSKGGMIRWFVQDFDLSVTGRYTAVSMNTDISTKGTKCGTDGGDYLATVKREARRRLAKSRETSMASCFVSLGLCWRSSVLS